MPIVAILDINDPGPISEIKEMMESLKALIDAGAKVSICTCGDHLMVEPPDDGWPDNFQILSY